VICVLSLLGFVFILVGQVDMWGTGGGGGGGEKGGGGGWGGGGGGGVGG